MEEYEERRLIMNSPKKRRLFLCVSKRYVDNPKTTLLIPYEQGIIHTNGLVCIGVDAWRDLDRKDCSSHPIKKYSSIALAKKDYYLISRKNKTIIKKENEIK